jgi:phosphatidylcholine synthase
LTYVFIPAYALFQSGLFNGWTGWVAIIVITFASALYFADTRMKTKDNSFSGFPGCWNMFAVVIFATHPNFYVILALVIILAASMFTPLKFIHPVRTERWRIVSLPIALLWTILAGICAWTNFNAGPVVTISLALSSTYLLGVGILQQIFPPKAA